MKKIFTLFATVVFCHFAFGQAQRLVLVEEFTQASCPPCAQQNPGFNSLLSQNTEKATSIKYQVWWPGYDPMYNQNEPDVDARVGYYSVNGVPSGFVDGEWITNDCGYYTGAPACLNQTEIDNANGVTSPLELSLTHSLSSDLSTINVSLTINSLASITGDFVAHVAVVEKEINFSSPPGSNGEMDFYNVMKKMLPSASGTALPATIDIGYTNTIDVSWTMANVYNLNEIAVVAWVQNDDDKSVLQAAYSEPLPPPTSFALVSTVSSSSITCDGNLTPSVTIKNDGLSDLTSAEISYKLDSGTPSVYSWTGTLAPGAVSSSISLPTLAVTNGSHTFSASVTNVNGTAINPGIILPVVPANGIGTPGLTPIEEGFVSTTFPPTGWSIINPGFDVTWIRTTATGGFGESNNCTKYSFYTIPEGAMDELYVQNFDFSDVSQTEAILEFSIAKAKFTGYNDELRVLATTDCGLNWTTLYDKDDANGLFTATSSSNWTPPSANPQNYWRKETIDITDLIGNDNVIVKFVAISGYGNNMYIDDINIHYGATVGIDDVVSSFDVSVFPNPSNELTTVQINGNVPSGSVIELQNVMGQNVYSATAKSGAVQINTADLPSGMYLVRIVNNSTTLKQDKLNVIH